jgi:hypothetical protein
MSPLSNNERIWLHGLAAAFIGGGASAVSAGFANTIIDPDHFNLHQGFGHLAEMMAVTFCVSAILAVMGYLKQSPIPPDAPGPSLSSYPQPEPPAPPPLAPKP